MRSTLLLFTFFISLFSIQANAASGYLHANGKKIVDGDGKEVLLRGMGLGGWMLQEGYMLETSSFAGTQHAIKATIQKLVGEEATEDFYNAWLANYCTKEDVDSMAAWGFNSIRLPMHYNLYTLPIEEEPVAGKDTWLEKGFQMTDSLLKWCAANNMYLILDLHATPGGQGKDANISDYDTSKKSLWESTENRRKTVALWKKLAERYANEPWIGGYDLINETNWDMSGNTLLKNIYSDITKAIRTVDSNHLIIIEGNWFANDFTGLTPPWDKNMAYSFHRYWCYNTQGTLDFVTNIRNTHNVPLWMGESGENSNVWFTNAIELLEKNNIGWAWWTYKKIGSVTGTVTIPKTAGWQKLLNYWSGSGSKPTVELAKQYLMEQAEAMKLKNSIVHYDVVDAMFRQVSDRTSIPFKQHNTPCTIFAVDYDLGANNYAYFDTDTADFHVSTDVYTAWNSGYAYRNDAVDIEACTDTENNGYSVGFTSNTEWMVYTINVDSTLAYDFDLRYAALNAGGKIHLELDGVNITDIKSLGSTGSWTKWSTSTFKDIVLQKGTHRLKLYIDNSGFNINFLKFYNPHALSQIAPQFINFKTSESGSSINIVSNVGYDSSIAVNLASFMVNVDNKEVKILSAKYDETDSRIIVLEIEGGLIRANKVTLSYSGSELKSPSGTAYSTFTNKTVLNTSPVFVVLPAKIQAENYVNNNGLEAETCTDTGAGKDMGYSAVGDYIDFDVFVANAGTFKFDYRIASTMAGEITLQLITATGVQNLHKVAISSTGGWQVWKTLSANAELPQGKNTIRIYVSKGQFNINWFNVTITSGVGISLLNEAMFNISCNGVGQSIVVYPSNLNVEASTVTCYSISGQKIFTEEVSFTNRSSKILSNVIDQKGVYIIHLKTKSQLFAHKIVIR